MSAPRYYLEGNFLKYKALFLAQEGEKVRFSAGSVVVYPHTTWERFYYLLSGQVKLSIVEESLEKNLAFCGADYLVPFATLPDDPIQNLIQVEAATEVEALAVSRATLERLIKETPALKDEMYHMLLDYIYLLAHELESQTFDSGMEKLASFLYTVYENTGECMVNIPMNALRSFVGLNRTNMNKYMNALIADGVVQKTTKNVRILQPQRLRAYCSMRLINCRLVPNETAKDSSDKYDFKQEMIHEIHRFLSLHFRDQAEINHYLSSLPMDGDYLNRLFKLQYDITIRSFILEKRLNDAAENLIQTNKKIVDIAYESGFDSVSSFYRSFKKHMGMAPSDYRKKNV